MYCISDITGNNETIIDIVMSEKDFKPIVVNW